MASLEEIRNKLLQQQEKKERGSSGSSGDNQIYPFWNIPDGSTATIRFLPDGDDSNTFFWRERLVIRLPFPGIKGQDEDKATVVQVPCMEMYGKSCPILQEIRPWFKDPDLDPLARKYWKKRSYLFQGFVVNDPMGEESKPENPIRRFVINPSIFDIIKESLMDADMEELPTDYTAGRDFKLKKTRKGEYANYSSSSWSTRARPLNEEELEAVNKYGLYELKDFLPNEPDEDGIEVIKQMFKASVEEELYDPELWGEYFRPFGMQAPQGSSNSSSPKPKATEAKAAPKPKQQDTSNDDDDDEPAPSPKAKSSKSESKSDVNDALSSLRSRVKQTDDSGDGDEGEAEEAPAKPKSDKPDPKEVLRMIQERSKKNSA